MKKQISHFQITKILGFDPENNLYFTTSNKTYILHHNTREAIEITGLNGPQIEAVFFNNNKAYFTTASNTFVLNKDEMFETNSLPSHIQSVKYFLFIKNQIYIGSSNKTYILNSNHEIIKELDFNSYYAKFNGKDNIYFLTSGENNLVTFNMTTQSEGRIVSLRGLSISIENIFVIENNTYIKGKTDSNTVFYKIDTNNRVTKTDIYEYFSNL